MNAVTKVIDLNTTKRCQMLDITDPVASFVSEAGVKEGLVTVYSPHTTAAITINENADPDVVHDILMTLEEIFPKNRPGYRHGEGNSDAHIKTSLFGPSQSVIITNGRLQLGTWQSLYFCEFDGPRPRTVHLQIIR